ncbi:MAG: sulfotransferase [Balneolaceae bacterium]|nr:sulfotransferase [Balneolaceae bacterium]
MIETLKYSVSKRFPSLQTWKHRIEVNDKQKIFCIGFGKTGTTSLTKAFRDIGYRVGHQRKVIIFMREYAKRNFEPIIQFCKTAQVFQDNPFGLPYTFQALDQAYPDSKFILTVRDSAEQWYQSLINHHIKAFGKNGELPTRELYERMNKAPGLSRWEYEKLKFNTPENDIFDEKSLKSIYLDHIETVRDYFRYRKKDLLEINLSENNAYQQFCDFLGEKPLYGRFPHLNKGSDL